jgi:DNA-binding NarL/FixJ family response regulator
MLRGLSNRESRVLGMLAQGQTMKEIADLLGISRGTVAVHKRHIMIKLQLRDLSDVVRVAYQQGAVPPEIQWPECSDEADGDAQPESL